MSKSNSRVRHSQEDMADTDTYAQRATAAAHEAVDRVGAKAERAEERLREAADDMQRRSHDARLRARDMGEEATLTARTYVNEHPIASLAVAFGVGMLISAVMRR